MIKNSSPFGMQMPGRSYISGNQYRYGFNGKELDKDINGNNYDYGFRIYNSQLGRFLSIDPYTYSYPYYTPYQFAGNMPIAAIDLDGLEQYVVIYYKDQNNNTTKLEVRAIFENKDLKNPLNQHVHKLGSTKDIAKGNVLVFEIKKNKDGKESMKIVDRKDNNNLTVEEAKIFQKTIKKQKPEPESGEVQTLDYFTDGTLYKSRKFENDNTKTFDAESGILKQKDDPQQGNTATLKTKKVVELEIFVTGSPGPDTDYESNQLLINSFKKAGSLENKIFNADLVILKHIVHYNTDPKTMSNNGTLGGKASGELRVTKTYTISN